MKRRTKYLAGVAFATLLSFLLFSFSCSSSEGKSANTAFADTAPAVAIAKDSLAVAEAMQNVFRSISSGVLPSIVEIDVIENMNRISKTLSPVSNVDGLVPIYLKDR